jgi:hypothetical protein
VRKKNSESTSTSVTLAHYAVTFPNYINRLLVWVGDLGTGKRVPDASQFPVCSNYRLEHIIVKLRNSDHTCTHKQHPDKRTNCVNHG